MKKDDEDLARERFNFIPTFKVVGKISRTDAEREQIERDMERHVQEVREAREKAKKKKGLLNNQPTE